MSDNAKWGRWHEAQRNKLMPQVGPDLADDLAQDAFLNVWGKQQNGVPIQNPEAYAAEIARRSARRPKKKYRSAPSGQPVETLSDTERPFMPLETREELEDNLDLLRCSSLGRDLLFRQQYHGKPQRLAEAEGLQPWQIRRLYRLTEWYCACQSRLPWLRANRDIESFCATLDEEGCRRLQRRAEDYSACPEAASRILAVAAVFREGLPFGGRLVYPHLGIPPSNHAEPFVGDYERAINREIACAQDVMDPLSVVNLELDKSLREYHLARVRGEPAQLIRCLPAFLSAHRRMQQAKNVRYFTTICICQYGLALCENDPSSGQFLRVLSEKIAYPNKTELNAASKNVLKMLPVSWLALLRSHKFNWQPKMPALW